MLTIVKPELILINSVLQPIAGFENPPNDAEADGEKSGRHCDADRNSYIGDLVKAPAKSADQVDDRIEQRHRPPDRRQDARGIETAAEERQRSNDQKRHDLQLLETVRPN